MMIYWYEFPSQMVYIIELSELVFTCIFTTEAIIKIIGLGVRYFYDKWNIFDFVIVLGGIASNIIEFTYSIEIFSSASSLRMFRIARLFKVFRK